jgi:membrane-bound metal-dependent hydrolase YbcI (DUF457 family)
LPVLGHAIAGWATAEYLPPLPRDGFSRRPCVRTDVFWIPLVVALAYLPDIVSQIAVLTGIENGRLLGHSVPLAMIGAPALAILLSRATGILYRRALLVSVLSVMLHDLLDLLQATDRAPWWPVSSHRTGWGIIPDNPLQEALLFGAVFAVYKVWRLKRPDRRAGVASSRGTTESRRRLVVGSRALTATIIVAALVTHSLRARREGQLERAAEQLERHDYAGALRLLERARRWPSTAQPGQIDHLMAEAYSGLGDRRRAEHHYLNAFRDDPTRFWTVADLAVFYASSDRPLSERCREVEPYRRRLQEDFAGHERQPVVLARLFFKLGGCPQGAEFRVWGSP